MVISLAGLRDWCPRVHFLALTSDPPFFAVPPHSVALLLFVGGLRIFPAAPSTGGNQARVWVGSDDAEENAILEDRG